MEKNAKHVDDVLDDHDTSEPQEMCVDAPDGHRVM